VNEGPRAFHHPLFDVMLRVPGLDVLTTPVDWLLTWGFNNSLWVFPMATSCCGIELMAAAASRVDLDRMGTFVRATPRQCDVMVVAGTITVKMAPRVKRLWEQMPEPKWCIAMGSCAISGDFYREIYSVVPGIDTFLPVDVYIPGCPPNPEGLMHGLMRLQEKVRLVRAGKWAGREARPETPTGMRMPSIPRLDDPARDPDLSRQQELSAEGTGPGCDISLVKLRRRREQEQEATQQAALAAERAQAQAALLEAQAQERAALLEAQGQERARLLEAQAQERAALLEAQVIALAAAQPEEQGGLTETHAQEQAAMVEAQTQAQAAMAEAQTRAQAAMAEAQARARGEAAEATPSSPGSESDSGGES